MTEPDDLELTPAERRRLLDVIAADPTAAPHEAFAAVLGATPPADTAAQPAAHVSTDPRDQFAALLGIDTLDGLPINDHTIGRHMERYADELAATYGGEAQYQIEPHDLDDYTRRNSA